jgi:hypothetical protein
VQDSVIANNRAAGILYGPGSTALANTIYSNTAFGINNVAGGIAGFGNNTLFGNNGGASQVFGVTPLQPNACGPEC